MFAFSSLILDNIYENSQYFDKLLNDSFKDSNWELNNKASHTQIKTFDAIKDLVQYADGYHETISVTEEPFSIDTRFIPSELIKEFGEHTENLYFKRGLIEFRRTNSGLWMLTNGSKHLVDEYNGFAFGCCRDLLCTVLARLSINSELIGGLMREENCKEVFPRDEITVIYPEQLEDL